MDDTRPTPTEPERRGEPRRLTFDALDLRPVERWIERRAPAGWSIERSDEIGCELRYFDTADWRLYRAGLYLSATPRGESVRLRLEPVDPSRSTELPVREEHVRATLDQALSNVEGLFGGRVGFLAGARPLELRTRMLIRQRQLSLGNATGQGLQVLLDHTSVPYDSGSPPAELFRVEVEIASDDPALSRFAEELETGCGLRTATLSRFQAALAVRGIAPRPLPELGPDAVDATQTAAEAAFAVLRKQFRRMRAEEPGTRLGDDIEALHDMRVAMRRMRAAMRLFEHHLPPRVLRFNAELRWVGRALGTVRDLDVQLETLRGWQGELPAADAPALDALRERLAARRIGERRRMLRVLDSRRYERLLDRLQATLVRGASRRAPEGRVPILAAAPELIRHRRRRVIKLGSKIKRGTRPDAYHRLRIRCKALRYALEFHADVYGPATRRVIRDLVSLQDILGDHQDADVAVGWLRGLIDAPGSRLPARTAFVVGRLVERYERRAETLRRKFRKRFSRLSASNWKRLDQALAAAAPPVPAPSAARTRTPEPSDAQEPVEPPSPPAVPPTESTANESLRRLPTVEPRGDTEH